jgi:hypothetical protein
VFGVATAESHGATRWRFRGLEARLAGVGEPVTTTI